MCKHFLNAMRDDDIVYAQNIVEAFASQTNQFSDVVACLDKLEGYALISLIFSHCLELSTKMKRILKTRWDFS